MNILETERLILRKIKISDAPFILELLNDPSYIDYIRDSGVRSVRDAEKYISEKYLFSYQSYGFGLYLVELKHLARPLGICGLIKRDGLEDIDLGFAFCTKYWGHGYAYESALECLNFTRNSLQLKRVVAITTTENQGAIKVLLRIGFKFEKMIHLSNEAEGTESGQFFQLFGVRW